MPKCLHVSCASECLFFRGTPIVCDIILQSAAPQKVCDCVANKSRLGGYAPDQGATHRPLNECKSDAASVPSLVTTFSLFAPPVQLSFDLHHSFLHPSHQQYRNMALEEIAFDVVEDFDRSTVYTNPTPPESIVPDVSPFQSPRPSAVEASVPWPGSTYIVYSATTGEAIALRNGKVVLTAPSSLDSFHWECVERGGWLGFRNPVSGKYLGFDEQGRLCCRADKHNLWEKFCVRARPDGGFILLMTWGCGAEKLLPIGNRKGDTKEMVARVEGEASDGMVWRFGKVEM